MLDFLISFFIKDYENTQDISVRKKYGVFASVMGILSNVLLFVIKFLIGFFIKSVAVTADSFNNLSDAASSILTLIGFKISSKPADSDHPFGHGRFEYVSALFMAVFILFAGFEFLKGSVIKIFKPDTLNFSILTVIILFITCIIKILQGYMYIKIGKKINSEVLKANSKDSFSDSIITFITAISLIFYSITDIVIDGYMGLIVAFVILFAGLDVMKTTVSSILGQSVDTDIADELRNMILSYDGVLGVHDLLVHNYGPNNNMASIHVEVAYDVDINISHEIIDKIEKDVYEKMGILLVIHMDPVDTKDERIKIISKSVKDYLITYGNIADCHDFRIVDGINSINVVFDIAFSHDVENEKINKILTDVKKIIKDIDSRFNAVINVEKSFEKR